MKNISGMSKELLAIEYKTVCSMIEDLEKEKEELRAVILQKNDNREGAWCGMNFILIAPTMVVEWKKAAAYYGLGEQQLERFKKERPAYWKILLDKKVVIE